MKKKVFLTMAALSVLCSIGTVTAFAAEGYSYLDGQQRSRNRTEAYREAEQFTTDEERDEFLRSQGIGDTEYSEENAAAYSYVEGRRRGSGYHQ